MHEKRLLERIRDFEQDQDRRKEIDTTVLLHSVLAHLRCMLNTRQGSVPIAEDYGLADLTDLPGVFSPDNLHDIQAKITQVIEKYEPRLADILIEFVGRHEDALSLRFKISGRANTTALNMPVLFESVVEPTGKISINS